MKKLTHDKAVSMGRVGGSATGFSKVRGTSAYYRALVAKREAKRAQKKAV